MGYFSCEVSLNNTMQDCTCRVINVVHYKFPEGIEYDYTLELVEIAGLPASFFVQDVQDIALTQCRNDEWMRGEIDEWLSVGSREAEMDRRDDERMERMWERKMGVMA